MEVINDLLGYKNLKIIQNTDWFCFSIDSVLLARLSTINKNTKKIVDFCTGNIPVPLILFTRCNSHNTEIFGIEIQKEIYELACKTIKLNKLENKIKIINQNIINSNTIFTNEDVDLVTCNPPYFKYIKSSNINENSIKSIARHEIEVNLENVVISAKKILKNKGRLAIIHASHRISDLIVLLEKYNFGIKRIINIYPKKSSKIAEIVFVEATKNTNANVVVEKPIYIHDENGNYSKEILNYFT